MSKMTKAAKRLLLKGSETESSIMLPSTVISKHSLIQDDVLFLKELRTSSLAGFPASHSLSQGKDWESPTLEICGLPPSSAFAELDPNTVCWRTSQVSLFTPTLEPFSGTWPKA